MSNGEVGGGTETILVAEDHDGLQELARRALECRGYNVLLPHNGQEAVRLFEANRDKIGLVLLDVVMPVLKGPEAYAQMCSIQPDLPVIFTTGYTAESVPLHSKIDEGAVFLEKPYTPETLCRAIRQRLDQTSNRTKE